MQVFLIKFAFLPKITILTVYQFFVYVWMKNYVVFGSLLLIFSVLGCEVQYTQAPVTGTIGGDSFTFVSGAIDVTGFAEMYDEEINFSSPNGYTVTYPRLLFSLPEVTVAKYKLNFKLSNESAIFTATGLSVAEDNVLFDHGYIEIIEVTGTTVTGGMHIESAEDVLDGTFELERVAW
jgi:hypothetical protein